MNAVVQTSGPEPDMFADQAQEHASTAPEMPTQRGYDCTLTFTGQLRRRPHMAHEQCDSAGHFRPVLVLDLDHVGPSQQRLQAHVRYTPDTREQGEALAKSLKRGDQVTVTCQLADLRLFLAAASLSTDQPQ